VLVIDQTYYIQIAVLQNAPKNSIRGLRCSRRELALLRSLLLRNSRRMLPTAWQAQHLVLGPNSPWLASYITPVYPEDLGDCQTLIDALTPDVLDRVRTDAATATDSQLRNSAAAVAEAAAKMAEEEEAAGGGPMLNSRSSTAAARTAAKPVAAQQQRQQQQQQQNQRQQEQQHLPVVPVRGHQE
jgi:hypothetical protein